jgi:Lecithin retinol acyltransferase
MYEAGTVLKLDFGTFFHYGIADGIGGVIHNSKKWLKVTHEPYEAFAEGKEILISEKIGSNQPWQAVNIAMRYIGLPYDLFKSNCEQFVRVCHGLENESTQIQQYLLMALGAGIAIKSDNKAIQMAGGAIALASLLTPSEKSPFKNAGICALIAVGLVALSS